MSLNKIIGGKRQPEEHVVSEWFVFAIIAYWKIHANSKIIKKNPTVEEMVKQFNMLQLSRDSKELHIFTASEVKRDYDFYKKLFNANIAINNVGSIANNGNWNYKKELLKNIGVFTYSFPCQDLSTAGNMRGMSREGSTRSSLLWQVLNVLHNMQNDFNKSEMPRVLIMENVSVITSNRYSSQLDEFKQEISSLGYENIGITLNSSELGSPQNRKRYFLISIRKELLMKKDYQLELEKHVEEMKVKNPYKYKTLKQILRDFNKLKPSTRNEIYEKELQEMFEEGLINKKTKVTNASRAYPTFNQAKVVVGREYGETPTVTFQGEFSRIRVFDIQQDKVIVKQIGPRENWELMGFNVEDFNKIKNHIPETRLRSLPGNAITMAQLDCIFSFLFKEGIFKGGKND